MSEKKDGNDHGVKQCDHKKNWGSKKAFYTMKFTYFCPTGRKMPF